MFRLSFSCRTLVAVALAATLAAPATLSAVNAGSDHQQCERDGHSCGKAALVSCCCHAGQADQSAPVPSPSGRTTTIGIDATPVAVPAFATSVTDPDGISSAVLRMHSPPHGFHFADLSILLSTLLI